jgi:uncharacterized membrane protein YsdA (DUF1294 family)/cold shock CspA family protein
MKKQGTIVRWDVDKGFGFLRSASTPADVFFHIRDWRGGAAPPKPGLVVDYEEIHVGGKGPRGMAVQPVGQQASPVERVRRPAAARPATMRHAPARPEARTSSASVLLVVSFATLVAWAAVSGHLPAWVLPALAIVNVATFFAYAFDKYKATHRLWRTPEKTLHLLAFLGGWPAAGLAQRALRHKSRKVSFLATYRLTVAGNVLALAAWAARGLPIGA